MAGNDRVEINMTFNQIEDLVNTNSQSDQAAGSQNAEEKKAEERFRKARIESLKASLKAAGNIEEEIQKQLLRDKEEIEADQAEKYSKDKIKQLQEQAKYGATLQERQDAEHLLRIQKGYQEAANAFGKVVNEALDSSFNSIRQAGKNYAEYVERIEVGLIGSTKSYDTVTQKLDKVFGMNVFFRMDDALRKTTEMIESGINYNVELRASLDTISDKIAKSFSALDSTLVSLVKIQQQDSTQARLGMESLLLNYLNSNFQDSSYLQGGSRLSKQVSQALLQAESTKSAQGAVEFEYAVQKWLGSMSSVGVSDSTILALAQGLGYLGSGNVSALSSNSQLEQLMAISTQRGGGRSYGDILTSGIEASDVSSILSGFYNLVKTINSSGNMVALNQYANLFGMSMSDIVSVLNLTDENIKLISQDMASYADTVQQVNKELGLVNLSRRTSASEKYTNLKANVLTSLGLQMADDLAMNLMYEAIDAAANLVDMFDLGIEIDPFGVGTSTKIKAGSLLRGGTAAATYASEWGRHLASLTSSLSPNLSFLGGENGTMKLLGTGIGGTSQVRSGTVSNEGTYIGRTSNSAVYETVNQEGKSASSEIIQKDIDKEEEEMKKTQKAMKEIGDNVAFIVQLLNINGIVVRSYPGSGVTASPVQRTVGDSIYMRGGY